MVRQGLVLAYESMGCGNAIVSQAVESGRPILQFLWDSSDSDPFRSCRATGKILSPPKRVAEDQVLGGGYYSKIRDPK